MDYHDLILNHERVDDIPLIVGMLKDMGLPELVDRCVGTHGSQEGLSNGWLMVGWLAFILSEGDHRKYRVEEWADGLRETLASLFEQPVHQRGFADDRLGGLLARLDKDEGWEALESALWNGSVVVYDLPCTSVRLDATTTCGYHTPVEGGLMQLGYSKDHRPDLAQLKLMAAAAQPLGYLLGSDIHPGQAAEEAIYTPMVERVRWPAGIGRPGQTLSHLVEAVDVVPTLLGWAGIPIPPRVQGVPLPTSPGPDAGTKRSVLLESEVGKTLRTERYRYVVRMNGREELYDLERDLGEYYNIAVDQEYVGALSECRGEMVRRLLQMERPLKREWPY